MPRDLAKLASAYRALDDVNLDIQKWERVITIMKAGPMLDSFEEDAVSAYTNVIGRLKAMERKIIQNIDIYEQS